MINLEKILIGKEDRFLKDVSDSISGYWGSLDHLKVISGGTANVMIECLGNCIHVYADINPGIYETPVNVMNGKINFYNGTTVSMVNVIDNKITVSNSGTINGILRLKRGK